MIDQDTGEREELDADLPPLKVPFLRAGNWQRALVGGSFDGASVMLGAQNGVTAKLTALVPWFLAIHGIAHVTQLAVGDAFNLLPYYAEWKLVVQEVHVYYNGSGKKRHSLETCANEMDASLLKTSGTHGIRWAAAQARSIRAIQLDLPVIVVDLEITVKTELGITFTTLTASDQFVSKQFWQLFTDDTTDKTTRWKATVIRVIPSSSGVGAQDKLLIKYRSGENLEMPKSEVVPFMGEEDSRLDDHIVWQLRKSLTAFRFVNFNSFMLDVHNQLAILSKTFQAKSLIISDISKGVNKSLRALRALKEAPGEHEAAFYKVIEDSPGTDQLTTCPLYDGEVGRPLFKDDRAFLLDELADDIGKRFAKVLENPVLQAFGVFDHRLWPTGKDLDTFGDSDITCLVQHYSDFFTDTLELKHATALVLEHWHDMITMIDSAPGLKSYAFKLLWPKVVAGFSDDYPRVLRLVVIMLLVPVDTSEPERIFSMMNDIKVAERSSMSTAVLRDLIMWYFHGKEMPAHELPVLEIIKEWRTLHAELHGAESKQKPHRPAPPRVYDYTVQDGEKAPVAATLVD